MWLLEFYKVAFFFLPSGRAASLSQHGCAQRCIPPQFQKLKDLTRAGQGRLCDNWYQLFLKIKVK
jgi:hypothetical protein